MEGWVLPARMTSPISVSLAFLLVILQLLLAAPAISGRHEDNMKVVCSRVRNVNENGLSGLGYLEWFFAANSSYSPLSVRGFWKELKWRCPGIW